eukprot:COSAG01_NODE_603_length_14905_cov_12.534648_17_plen_111_part_00
MWYTKLDGTTMAMKRHMRQRTLTSLVDMGMTPAPQLDDPASRPMHVAIIPCAACLPPPPLRSQHQRSLLDGVTRVLAAARTRPCISDRAACVPCGIPAASSCRGARGPSH